MPVFMFDAFLNAGVLIATNGFLLKNSPAENRTMFIAAGAAFAGMAGGATSVLAGALLAASDAWSWDWHGYHVVNFHAMFAVSIVLRLAAIAIAVRIQEPSSAAVRVLAQAVLAEFAAAAMVVPRLVNGRGNAKSHPQSLAADSPRGESQSAAASAGEAARLAPILVRVGRLGESPNYGRKVA
jgi:MFS family permease